jgi:hypothetical protein
MGVRPGLFNDSSRLENECMRAIVSSISLGLVVIAGAFALSACTRFKDSYRVDDAVGFSHMVCPTDASSTTTTTKSKSSGDDYGAIDLCTLHLAGTPATPTAYEQVARCQYGVLPTEPLSGGATIPANPDICRLLRNSLQDFILAHSDKICAKHQAYIIANSAAWNVGLGFGANLLSGIGAVAGAGSTKAALAGAAAVTGGTRDLVNSEVYQKIFASAIVKASDTERLKRKTDILQKQVKSLPDYPVEMAIEDAQGYNTACSFASGVELVSQAVQRDSASYNALLTQQVDQLNTQIKAAEAILENKSTSDTLKKATEAQLLKLTAQRDVLQQQISPALGAAAGTSISAPAPPISISPNSVSVTVGKTQQFNVALNGATDTAITWQVNGTNGGSAASGTISPKGLYTAPSTVPTPPDVTATALLTSDTSKSASAKLTIAAPDVAVTVTPLTASVKAGGTQQFTAAVTNGTPSTVKWQVNGVPGGSAILGTISGTGLYTAPTLVPTPADVSVTATSDADQTKSASAKLTITAAAVTVTVSPKTASVKVGGTQQFASVVGGGAPSTVKWEINGVPGGSAVLGTINGSGLYAAPASVPTPAVVSVSAVSDADHTKAAAATVTVTH